jgi:hypothetical protein
MRAMCWVQYSDTCIAIMLYTRGCACCFACGSYEGRGVRESCGRPALGYTLSNDCYDSLLLCRKSQHWQLLCWLAAAWLLCMELSTVQLSLDTYRA